MKHAVPLEQYGDVLGDYLRTRGERELFRASLLSQTFIEGGVGPEEIVALHVEALDQSLAGASPLEQARSIGDAHQFLLEVMIAYGLKYREYFELKAQESVREAQAREELLATIAHELRSPLTAAAAALQMATRILAGGSRVDRVPPLVGSAQDALSRLSRLTANLVRVSQHEPVPVSRDPLDLIALVAEACDWVRVAAEEKGIEFVVSEGCGPLWVLGDTDALLSVVGNLLSNAVRYTPTGGRVTVDSGRADGMAWIEVRDTGIGMSPEVQARVFEKFYRAREARAVEAQGLGLGLTLVRDLVWAHGGQITLVSELGRGSTFRVTLPLATPEIEEELSKDG